MRWSVVEVKEAAGSEVWMHAVWMLICNPMKACVIFGIVSHQQQLTGSEAVNWTWWNIFPTWNPETFFHLCDTQRRELVHIFIYGEVFIPLLSRFDVSVTLLWKKVIKPHKMCFGTTVPDFGLDLLRASFRSDHRVADAVNAVVAWMSVRPSERLYSLVMMEASRHSRNDNVVIVPGALPDGHRVVACANTTSASLSFKIQIYILRNLSFEILKLLQRQKKNTQQFEQVSFYKIWYVLF